jgi:hypothetical protein
MNLESEDGERLFWFEASRQGSQLSHSDCDWCVDSDRRHLLLPADWLKWGLRGATHGIEAIGDSLPYPWGDRVEIVLRELGGIIWLQITAVILLLRFVLSSIALAWRSRRGR